MQRSKEILIFLLFVVFSFLIWFMRANYRQSLKPAQATRETAEELAEDYVTEKKLQMAVELQDVPQDRILRVFPSRVDVYVRLRVSDYEAVTEDALRVWCSYPTKAQESLMLHTDVTDERVLQVRVVPQKVEYLIEQE